MTQGLDVKNASGKHFQIDFPDTSNDLALTTKDLASTKLINTISELRAIDGSVADRLQVLGYYLKGDGGGGTFYWDSASTETDNGGTIIQATGITTGRWKRPKKGIVSVKEFGAKGDGITDDTVAIQKALYLNWNNNKTDVFPKVNNLVIYVPIGNYRITSQLHQPSGVVVYGDMPTSLQGQAGTNINDYKQTAFIFDFPYEYNTEGIQYTKKSAYLITGFSKDLSQTGCPVGDLLDPYLYNCAGSVYDDGYGTRSLFTSIKGIHFYTNKNIACGLGIGLNPNIEVDITTHGFLFGVIGQAIWGSKINVSGEAYFSGLVLTQLNGGYVSGYTVKTTSTPSNLPSFTSDLAPNKWVKNVESGYAEPFLKTGHYITYSKGIELKIIAEYWERAGVMYVSDGVITAPYYESNTVYGVQAISSAVSIDTPLVNNAGSTSFIVGNNSSSISIRNWNNTEKIRINSSNTLDSVSPQIRVELVDSTQIADDEIFRADMDIVTSTVLGGKTIYVSSTGNNTYTGLSSGNAVQTLDIALSRAKFYSIESITIVGSSTVNFGSSFPTIDNMKCKIKGSGATATWGISSNNTLYTVFKNCNIEFEGISVIAPAGSSSGGLDYRGAIVPQGNVNITFNDCDVSCPGGNAALFSTGGGQGAGLLNVNLVNSSTLNVAVMAYNGEITSGVRYLINKDSTSTITGTPAYQSLFTVV
jgi:hypothetical protein